MHSQQINKSNFKKGPMVHLSHSVLSHPLKSWVFRSSEPRTGMGENRGWLDWTVGPFFFKFNKTKETRPTDKTNKQNCTNNHAPSIQNKTTGVSISVSPRHFFFLILFCFALFSFVLFVCLFFILFS